MKKEPKLSPYSVQEDFALDGCPYVSVCFFWGGAGRNLAGPCTAAATSTTTTTRIIMMRTNDFRSLPAATGATNGKRRRVGVLILPVLSCYQLAHLRMLVSRQDDTADETFSSFFPFFCAWGLFISFLLTCKQPNNRITTTTTYQSACVRRSPPISGVCRLQLCW